MIYTDDWVFIHIPKTSGINLKTVLQKTLPGVKSPFNYNSGNMFIDLTQLERNIQHNPYWWWKERGILKDQRIITIVRNPYHRALSFYRFVISLHQDMFRDVSIQEFYTTDWYSKSAWKLDMTDVHWRYYTTQVEFLKGMEDNSKLDIYKYETDLMKLQDFFGVDITSTNFNSSEKYDYDSFYSEDTSRIEVINRIFEDDFRLLGYKMMEC